MGIQQEQNKKRIDIEIEKLLTFLKGGEEVTIFPNVERIKYNQPNKEYKGRVGGRVPEDRDHMFPPFPPLRRSFCSLSVF